MPVVLLVVVFIVVPLVELFLIIQVGQEIGALPTIAILVADSILGALLLRTQGRAAWRRFQQALAERRMPAREVMDGVLVIFGGAFLLTPGFLTDVFGLLLLIPPTRAVVRRLLLRWFGARFLGAATSAATRRVRRPPRARQPYDVEGEAYDVEPTDPPPLTR